jgi:hypothetical protein
MTSPILDDNLRRLLQSCIPRVSDADLDRAFARFEGRRRPAPAASRALAGLAAVLVLGLLGWLALSAPPKPAGPGAPQASPEDIARLINDLGSATPELREKAKTRLVALGALALGPLDRALYHEDPEVRIQSQAIARQLRRRAEVQPSTAFVRAAVKIVRARWVARDFGDFEQCVRDAFDPEQPFYVHYVPRKSVDGSFDTFLNDGQRMSFNSIRGMKDLLTPAMVAALDQDDGILFLDPHGEIRDLAEGCVFTLPDRVGWSAYVVVCLSEIRVPGAVLATYVCEKSQPLAFFRSATFSSQPGGGLKLGDLDATYADMARVLRKGDVLRALNGTPLDAVPDLLRLAEQASGTLRLTLERDGKVFSIEIKMLERVILIRTGPKAEAEAKALYEEAETLFAENPPRALENYRKLLSEYSRTEFVSKGKKSSIEERIAALKEKKK